MARAHNTSEGGRSGEAGQSSGSRIYLWIVAGIGVAIGLARVCWGVRDRDPGLLDFVTLAFLCTPLIVQILSNATEFNLGKDGISWKKGISSKLDENAEALAVLKQIVEQLKAMTAHGVGGKPRDDVSKDLASLPASLRQSLGLLFIRSLTKAPLGTSEGPESSAAHTDPPAPHVDPEDPQKGRWGGLAERNHRRLTAKVSTLEGDDDVFLVELLVESTQPNEHPLEGKVVWHLHDTFTPSKVRSSAKNGQARLVRYAWGAFTLGAETDDGATTLELDLSELPNAPKAFREN